NQYTVHVNVFKCDKWYNANKRQHNLFETIQKTFSNKKLIIHQYVCFDDGNFLYSRELLLNKVKTYEIIIKNELYQLDIKDMSDHVTVADMWQFVRSKTPYKRSQDLIRMFETLLKQTIRSYIVCIRNQFFEKNQTLYDDEWQIVDRSLMTSEQNKMLKNPNVQFYYLKYVLIKTMTITLERNSNNDPYLKHLSITIHTNEMLQIKNRLLDSPNIVYRNNRIVSVTIAK
ncbi:unnamed protein product, partial [Rotaria sp. Silwood1]